MPRPALNKIVLAAGVPLRVWYNNPAELDWVWLVAPDGVMKVWANEEVAKLPVALHEDPRAFPAADPVALPLMEEAA